MHHRVFQSFIDALSDGVDATSLHDALADIAFAFDLPLFAYLSIPRQLDGAAWLISNYSPHWTGQYMRRRLDRLDPVIVRARNGPEPFIWTADAAPANLSAAQRKFLGEAAAFGLDRGFTIPIPAVGNGIEVAALTLIGQGNARSFGQSIDRYGPVLQLAALYFHRHARRLLTTDRTIAGIRLTERELQCLQWAARGKSAWEIGRIVGISRRTAAFHLDNARAKLGVHSLAQAVALLAAARMTP
jgi:LuxR family transcriptional activator of conjugal transfer of Ti plasmids